MQMILFHCTNNECDAHFAVDTDTALFGEIHCPGCSGEDLNELGQMGVDVPTEIRKVGQGDACTRVVHVMRDEYDVYIGRAILRKGLKASVWANPFKIGRDGTREEVIDKYRAYLQTRLDLLARLGGLCGKRLAC